MYTMYKVRHIEGPLYLLYPMLYIKTQIAIIILSVSEGLFISFLAKNWLGPKIKKLIIY